MMRIARHRLAVLAAASALAISTGLAEAQSLPNPAFYYGFQPTPGQWNKYFSQKADYPGILTYTNTWAGAQTYPGLTVGGTVTLTGSINVAGTTSAVAVVPLLPQNQFLVGNVFGVAVNTTLVGDCTYQGSINCLNTNGAPFVAVATVPSASNLTSGTLGCAFTPAFSGDVNTPGASCATTIQPGVVTGSKTAGATITAANFVANTLPFTKFVQANVGNSILCNNGSPSATPQLCTTVPSVDVPAINLAAGNVNGGVFGNLPPGNFNSGINASISTWWRGDNGGQWTVPPGGHILLNTVSGSGFVVGDTTSFASGSAYSAFEIVFFSCYPATNNATPLLLVHTAGTGFALNNYFGATYRANSSGTSQSGSTIGVQLGIGQSSGTASPGLAGRAIIANVGNTTTFKQIYGVMADTDTNPLLEVGMFAGYWQGGTAAVDGIGINYTVGNVAACTIKVYGIP
jgi:hypothetical protein